MRIVKGALKAFVVVRRRYQRAQRRQVGQSGRGRCGDLLGDDFPDFELIRGIQWTVWRVFEEIRAGESMNEEGRSLSGLNECLSWTDRGCN